ncbi:hypothetical protein WM40_25540 [Robbsia andropogonis]|uniref:Cro/Cl family transcriptional regulator n=1 Tax=Robbsia andropogonis TaxID=28092 RepID=A0A0F5JTV7_9BURK|nr:Cro/CI family transcriptional regulator [Robbsia andropogonis]KKB61049.1 hypothetical protein WM40_25540 [Robbsia andropogonis]
MVLTKQQAIDMFGSGAALGRAVGVTKAAVWQWADPLDQRQTDMVVGAAMRLGKALPEGFNYAPTPTTTAVAA